VANGPNSNVSKNQLTYDLRLYFAMIALMIAKTPQPVKKSDETFCQSITLNSIDKDATQRRKFKTYKTVLFLSITYLASILVVMTLIYIIPQ
jgi:hypothetical protein